MAIQAGRYKAHGVAGSEQFGNSQAGNPQVSLTLALDNGQRVTAYLSFTEKAKPYSIERLYALGWQPGSEDGFPGIDKNEVEVDISYEMYQGKEQMKVNIVAGGGGISEENRWAPSEKKSFLKGLNLDAKPQFTSPPAQQPQTQANGPKPRF